MCQAVNKTFLRLIAAALTLLVVQKAQSMPSRNPPGSQSQTNELIESTLYAEDTPPIVTNVTNDRIKRNENNNNRNERHGHGASTTHRTPSTDDGTIRFPGEIGSRVQPVPQPKPDCMGRTFCEETASDYPQEYLSNIISRTDSLRQFANVDLLEIGERLDSPDADMLCGSQSKVVFPKVAQNEKKEWVFVLQDDKQGYRQGVKIENCNEGTAEGRCQVIEEFVTGYTTSCKQKYVFRVLAAVDQSGSPNADPIRMPSSCCCQIKYVGGNVGSRIAAAVTPLKDQTPAVTAKPSRKP